MRQRIEKVTNCNQNTTTHPIISMPLVINFHSRGSSVKANRQTLPSNTKPSVNLWTPQHQLPDLHKCTGKNNDAPVTVVLLDKFHHIQHPCGCCDLNVPPVCPLTTHAKHAMQGAMCKKHFILWCPQTTSCTK